MRGNVLIARSPSGAASRFNGAAHGYARKSVLKGLVLAEVKALQRSRARLCAEMLRTRFILYVRAARFNGAAHGYARKYHAHLRRTLGAGMLQRSRARLCAEICRSCRRLSASARGFNGAAHGYARKCLLRARRPHGHAASTEPRTVMRGNLPASDTTTSSQICFNGAAHGYARKSCGFLAIHPPGVRLQRSRARLCAEMSRSPTSRPPKTNWLQRSRARLCAEIRLAHGPRDARELASTEPRTVMRGNTKKVVYHLLKPGCFNGAAHGYARKSGGQVPHRQSSSCFNGTAHGYARKCHSCNLYAIRSQVGILREVAAKGRILEHFERPNDGGLAGDAW